MNWRDLLYFSKGERRALTLLLCLISISWIILLLTDNKPKDISNENNKRIESVKTTRPIDSNKPKPEQEKIAPSGRKNNFSRKEKDFHPKGTPNIPGRKTFPKTEKYPVGTVVELNSSDTTSLKKVPGIGSTFARRIIKYRDLLGGFYRVEQLREVYGIDEEKYDAIKSWFSVDISAIHLLSVNHLPADSLRKHPYLNYGQAHAIGQLRKQKRILTGWENLQLLEEFTETDKERLIPYLSFE